MRVVLMASKSPVSMAIASALTKSGVVDFLGIVDEKAKARTLGRRVSQFSNIARKRGIFHAISRFVSIPIHHWYDSRRNEWLAACLPDGNLLEWPTNNTVVVESVNSKECHDAVEAWRPDIIVLSGTQILTPETIALSRIDTLNIHHGVLPEIRGMYSIFWALAENRRDWIGVTLHRVVPRLDAGDILAQARVEPLPGDGEVSLFARATRAGIALLTQTLEIYSRGKLPSAIARAHTQSIYRSVPTFAQFVKIKRTWGHILPLEEARHYQTDIEYIGPYEVAS